MKDFMHGSNIYIYDNAQKIIDLSSNINPLGFKEEWLDYTLKELSIYPDNYATTLRTSLANKYQLKSDNFFVGNGASDVLYRYVYATKPKQVLLLAPTFSEYEKALVNVQAKIDYYALDCENDFGLDLNYLEKLKEKDYDLIILAHPNNPNGALIPANIALEILNYSALKNINVLVDECFIDLVYTTKYSFKQWLSEYANLFVLDAFTKSYAMAGLRIGFGICTNHNLIKELYQVGADWPVNIIALNAANNALKEKDYLTKACKYLEKEASYLEMQLKRLNFKTIKTSTNYLLFFSKYLGLKELLLKEDILIRSCGNYHNLGLGWYRIAISTSSNNQRLIKALEKILVKQGECDE